MPRVGQADPGQLKGKEADLVQFLLNMKLRSHPDLQLIQRAWPDRHLMDDFRM